MLASAGTEGVGASVAGALAPAVEGPPTYWRLTGGVTATIACGRVLFLDVARDRYFALPPNHNELFANWLSTPAEAQLSERCRVLLTELGIVSSDTAASVTPRACTVATPAPFDSETVAPVPFRPATLLGIARAVFTAWRDVRTKPLAAVVQRRFLFSSSSRQRRFPDRTRRLAEFRTFRPMIPVPRVCLHDCLALIDWLGGPGSGAQIVFGVSPYPFAAHCWVQADGRVLDDHPESPSRFQPILHLP